MHNKVFKAANWERLVSPERVSRMDPQKFLGIAEPGDREIWLDLGCGPGFFTLPLAEQVQKIYATDISRDMLEICQTRAAESKLSNITYIESASAKLNVESSSLDKVLIANVYHEFPSTQEVINELSRLLKQDGRLYVIDWRFEQMEMGPPLEHRIPEIQVIDSFESAGFQFRQKHDIYEHDYFLEFAK